MNKFKEYIELEKKNKKLELETDQITKRKFEANENRLAIYQKEYYSKKIKELNKQRKQEKLTQTFTGILIPLIILFFTYLELKTGINVNLFSLLIADTITFTITGLMTKSSLKQTKKIDEELFDLNQELINLQEELKQVDKSYEELSTISFELQKKENENKYEMLKNKRKLEELKSYILNNTNIKTLKEPIKVKKLTK